MKQRCGKHVLLALGHVLDCSTGRTLPQDSPALLCSRAAAADVAAAVRMMSP